MASPWYYVDNIYCKLRNISRENISILGVTDMLANITIGSSLKIVHVHRRLLSSYDVEPLPFALLYLQKSNLVSHYEKQ